MKNDETTLQHLRAPIAAVRERALERLAAKRRAAAEKKLRELDKQREAEQAALRDDVRALVRVHDEATAEQHASLAKAAERLAELASAYSAAPSRDAAAAFAAQWADLKRATLERVGEPLDWRRAVAAFMVGRDGADGAIARLFAPNPSAGLYEKLGKATKGLEAPTPAGAAAAVEELEIAADGLRLDPRSASANDPELARVVLGEITVRGVATAIHKLREQRHERARANASRPAEPAGVVQKMIGAARAAVKGDDEQ